MDFKPFKIGKYLLLEKLAAGGMAEVYRAKASGAGGFEKQLAIKRILPHYSANEEFRRMFEYEARLSSLLTHANVVQIYDFVKSNDTYLLAMEYVRGKNLRQLVNKAKKAKIAVPIQFGVYTVMEVCKGLDYAHKKKEELSGRSLNIIHRDMSPQNVMLSYEGAVKIVDFGIAKAKDRADETRSGVIKGKFGYMSPEQANGHSVTHLTDVFSTGIILFELLTGTRLFSSDNDMATLRMIQECAIPNPSRLNPRITLDLERIVLKALTKDTKLRYQEASLLGQALQEYLAKHFPSYSQREVATFIQQVFKEEIDAEKKRNEELHRQSIPFSQGAKTEDEEVVVAKPQTQGIDEDDEGNTRSDVEGQTKVTNADEEFVQDEELVASQQEAAPVDADVKTQVADSVSIEAPADESPEFASPLETKADPALPKFEEAQISFPKFTDIAKNAEPQKAQTPVSPKTQTNASFKSLSEGSLNDSGFPVLKEGNQDASQSNSSLPSLSEKSLSKAPVEAAPTSDPKDEKTQVNSDVSLLINSSPSIKNETGTPSTNLRSLGSYREESTAATDKGQSTIGLNSPSLRRPEQTNTPSTASISTPLEKPVRREPTILGDNEGLYNDRFSDENLGRNRRSFSRNIGNTISATLLVVVVLGTGYFYSLYVDGKVPELVERLVGSDLPGPRKSAPKKATTKENPVVTQTVERRIGGECFLQIDSDPTGARVFINDRDKGITPMKIAGPCHQALDLTLRLDGFETVSENVLLKERDGKTFKRLESIPVGLLELTLAQNAKVYVDGVFIIELNAGDPYEFTLRAGRKHAFRFINPILGFDVTKNFIVNEGELIRVPRLQFNPGTKRR